MNTAMRGRIVSLKSRIVRAWAWDPERPDASTQVTITVDGTPSAPLPAQAMISADSKAGFPGGPHGVHHPLPLALFPEQGEVVREVVLERVADDGSRTRLHARRMSFPPRATLLETGIEKFRRGVCQGWAGYPWDPGRKVEVRLLHGNQPVATAIAEEAVSQGKATGTAHGFTLAFAPELWRVLAPGERLQVRTADGDFIGSVPIPPEDAAAALFNAARQAERTAATADALALVERVLLWQPEHTEALWLGARLANQHSDAEASRAFARQVIAHDPAHGPALNLLARLTLAEGLHEEALQLWARVPPTTSAYREAQLRRGQTLRDLGRPWEAIPLARQLLAIHDDPDAQILLGRAYLDLGLAAAAQRYLSAAAARRPDDRRLQDQLASAADQLTPPPARSNELFAHGGLKSWTGPAASRLDASGLRQPSLFLRALSDDAGVDYRIGAPVLFRTGDLPSYAVQLAGAGELGLLLRRDAIAPSGLRLYFEACVSAPQSGDGPHRAATLEVWLTDTPDPPCGAPAGRRLVAATVGHHPSLVRFDLIPSAMEMDALAANALWLVLRLVDAPAGAVVRVPWPLEPLAGDMPAAIPAGAEGLDATALELLGGAPTTTRAHGASR